MTEKFKIQKKAFLTTTMYLKKVKYYFCKRNLNDENIKN